MDWRDEGVLLLARPHGETSAVAEIFTLNHGRHAGVVRGAASRRNQPLLQPGAQLSVIWRARLEDHVGSFTLEPIRSRTAQFSDRLALAGLSAVTALLAFALPERDPHPDLYHLTVRLLDRINQAEEWQLDYLLWERDLLEELGFGMDLSRCAVVPGANDLTFVSPKTGRAVSRAGAGEWADRLLPLPPCLLGHGPARRDDILQGLKTTGHFLNSWLAPSLGDRPLPAARQRLCELLARNGNRVAN